MASELSPHVQLNDAAQSWVVDQGIPLYYTSANFQYTIHNHLVTEMPRYEAGTEISLSPSTGYRLLTLLQELDAVKDEKRYSDYFILNDQGDLAYKVSRGSDTDLKPFTAAISDKGILVLADPVKAKYYFYKEGGLIAEGQLYEDEGSFSMERNIHVGWVDDQCYILLERPGHNGAPGANVLFISLNADGRGQRTAILPFTYLQQFLFKSGRFFISGYNYNSTAQQMEPLIIEVDGDGAVLWTNENFGHELALSLNGNYLACLSSHETIQLFDLKAKRVKQIDYPHENQISIGLSINDQAEMAVIRVPVDFFVKKNTYFAQVYFPQSQETTTIQIDPRFPNLFQIYSDGKGFFIGTNYEWLEIR